MSREQNLTRRSLVAGLGATIPAAAVAAPALATEPDPIFQLIEAHRAAYQAYGDAIRDLEEAEDEAGEYRPLGLVAWRRYSHIGGAEIDRARREFLGEFPAWPAVAPAEQIEAEYLEKKAEYAAQLKAEDEWYERHGIASFRQKRDEMQDAVAQAEDRLFTTRPTTQEGLLALATYGCELTDYSRETPAYRILAALAGIPEADDEDEDEDEA
jgi:hypothetical protein